MELSSGQSVASVTTRFGVGVDIGVIVGADNSPRFYSRARAARQHDEDDDDGTREKNYVGQKLFFKDETLRRQKTQSATIH